MAAQIGMCNKLRTISEIGYESTLALKMVEIIILFSKRGKLTHLGIHYQGKILSKEANLATEASIRPLEDVVSFYGEYYQILRKNLEK